MICKSEIISNIYVMGVVITVNETEYVKRLPLGLVKAIQQL